MNLSLIYKTAFKNSKPFEDPFKSESEFSMSVLITGIIDELAEKKEDISFIGLFLCYLKKAGLDLNDLEFSLKKLKNYDDHRRFALDKFLYMNCCKNKLFDDINKAKEAMPNFFKDILPSETQDLDENNLNYSQLLLVATSKEFFTEVLNENLKGKDLEHTAKGKELIKFIELVYSMSDKQHAHFRIVEQVVKKTKLKPSYVHKVMQDMVDGYSSSKIEFAQELYNRMPKYKIANKRTLSNGGEVKEVDQENQNWHRISELGKYVIGQDEAVDKVIEKIMGSYVGFQSQKEPVATFLLTGPTGVGKTETAKGVADLCFDKKLFVVDMTTFKTDVDISRLLGGSPNYVGYNDPNAFCNFLQENPKCVLLFDEIDKAHKGCLDLLMRMIDEGEFINAKGEVVSLRDAVIICTTNLTEYVEDKTSRVEEKITNKDGLRKEIVGRFNEVIEYKPLTKDACKQIAEKFFLSNNIENFETRNQDKFLKLEYSDDLLDKIVDDANYRLFGARDLKKSIQKNFISPVTKYIIRNNPHNQTLYVDKDCVKPVETKAEKTTTENRFENKGME